MPRYLNSPAPKFFPCGVCGGDVPSKALACPDCGADDRTGLHNDEDPSGALGIEDEDSFSYDDFIRREFPSALQRPAGLHWKWWITGILLVIILAWGAFRI